ncbi:MAG TPA: hypothetical protein VGA67_03665 [Candidatus Dojkabacteria bacterium]|jgi:hypothetical protein
MTEFWFDPEENSDLYTKAVSELTEGMYFPATAVIVPQRIESLFLGVISPGRQGEYFNGILISDGGRNVCRVFPNFQIQCGLGDMNKNEVLSLARLDPSVAVVLKGGNQLIRRFRLPFGGKDSWGHLTQVTIGNEVYVVSNIDQRLFTVNEIAVRYKDPE